MGLHGVKFDILLIQDRSVKGQKKCVDLGAHALVFHIIEYGGFAVREAVLFLRGDNEAG